MKLPGWLGDLLVFYAVTIAAAFVVGLPILAIAWVLGVKHEQAMMMLVVGGGLVWYIHSQRPRWYVAGMRRVGVRIGPTKDA